MTVSACAKVNLTLDVLGRREDGYHDLRSVVLPVSLADALTVEPSAALTCDSGYADDLCLKAARALDERRGAALFLTKRIPVGGGLGGGSADAAATLRSLNELWGLGKTTDELVEIAGRVGSDVPALVLGGPVLMEGRGECVTALEKGAFTLNLVLVNPGVFSSTAEVYARCTPRGTAGPSSTTAMVRALTRGDFDGVLASLSNDLQTAAVERHPEIGEAMDFLRHSGAEGVLMSGSGSTVFGLVRTAGEAEDLAERAIRAGYAAWAVRG